MSKIINFSEVSVLTGLSKSTINRLEKIGKFPKRLKLSKKRIGWAKSGIDSWVSELQKESIRLKK